MGIRGGARVNCGVGARLEGNSAAPLRAKLVPTGTSQAKASSVVVVVIGAVAAQPELKTFFPS